ATAAADPSAIRVGSTQNAGIQANADAPVRLNQSMTRENGRPGRVARKKNKAASSSGIPACQRRSPVRSEEWPTPQTQRTAMANGKVEQRVDIVAESPLALFTSEGSQRMKPYPAILAKKTVKARQQTSRCRSNCQKVFCRALRISCFSLKRRAAIQDF